MLEGARRATIVWNGGVNWTCVSWKVGLRKPKPKDLEPQVSETIIPYCGVFFFKGTGILQNKG